MRVFILHDEEGKVLSVGQFDEIHEGTEQPYQAANPKHGVVELLPGDEGFRELATDRSPGKKKGLLKLHSEIEVDKKTKKILKKDERIPVIDKDPITRPAPEKEPPTRPLPDDKTPTDPKRPPILKQEEPGKTPPTRDPTNPKLPSEK